MKNPLFNAISALAYISSIVLLINVIGTLQLPSNQIIIPIIMLSLFTLSAAIMGYLFCYQPLILYLDGKKKEAVKLFLQTVGIFALGILGILLGYLLIVSL